MPAARLLVETSVRSGTTAGAPREARRRRSGSGRQLEALNAAPEGRGEAAGARGAGGAWCSAPAEDRAAGDSWVPGSVARSTSQLLHPAFPRSGRRVPSPSARATLRESLGAGLWEDPETRNVRLGSGTWSLGNGSAEPGSRLARGEALNTKVGLEPPCGAAAPPHYACIEKQTNKNISNAPSACRAPAPRAPGLPAFSFLHSRAPFARPLSRALRAAIGPG